MEDQEEERGEGDAVTVAGTSVSSKGPRATALNGQVSQIMWSAPTQMP